ncbi:MAG: two-component sensor histidine kinase [Lachnospiraceae bacterium]|nr:two-component sensor histidine kinase [Lachnospiraceae bacterium]
MLLKLREVFHKFRLFPSLRVRLLVIIMVVGILPSVLMRYGIMQSYEDRAVALRTNTVQNQLRILANHLITYNYLQDNSSEVIGAELAMLSNLYDGRVVIIGGNFKVVKDTYDISQGKTIISEEVIRSFRGETLSNYDSVHGYIEMTTPITETVKIMTDNGEVEETVVRGVMLTSISTDSIIATMDSLNQRAMILEALMIVVIISIAILLSDILTRPFARITQAINDVKAGYSDKSISVPDYMETVHIVDAFNQLLGRMKVLDDSRQEFVANVSHELKTPLASMKVLADSLLAQPEAPVEMYQEFMGDITAEIDRENQIITDLLALVKMDKKAADLNISTVNINELTELVLKRLRPIARKKDVEVIFESIRPVTAEVDEVKMTLIISNLVENAIKYNKEHGSVEVVLNADHQMFSLEISDTGIGIPEDSLEHIYERFYRVDKSHSKEVGGTGLGLAITRSAILMHRGSITVQSLEGEGSTFIVKIPLSHIAG